MLLLLLLSTLPVAPAHGFVLAPAPPRPAVITATKSLAPAFAPTIQIPPPCFRRPPLRMVGGRPGDKKGDEAFEVTWEHEDGSTDTTMATSLGEGAKGEPVKAATSGAACV